MRIDDHDRSKLIRFRGASYEASKDQPIRVLIARAPHVL